MNGIHLQYSCAHSVVSVQSQYAIPCPAMYPYSTRAVVCSTRTRQWLMRCAVRAASAQIKIKDYGGGGRYEGQMNQYGQRHGKGVYSWSNGRRYVGEWSENMYHGHGTCTYADGRVESGKWEKNKFLG